MARGTTYRLGLKRRREGRTDYRRRTRYLVSGLPRLVVRRSNAHYFTHIVIPSESGDISIVSAHSRELPRDYGWKGHGASGASGYLTGYLCGRRALEAGISEAILDVGLALPKAGSNLFAVLKGAVDAGLKIPCDEGIFPSMERIRGDQLVEGEGGEESAAFRKKGVDLSSMPKAFNSTIEKMGAPKEES